MKFFRSIFSIQNDQSPKIATIGNFDGVHTGHRLLLDKTTEISKENKLKSLIITFYPHTKNKANIFGLREKLQKLSELGFDYCLALRFSNKFKSLSPEDFIKNILINNNIKKLVIGSDFVFGKDKKGDVKLLQKFAKTHDFEVIIINRKCKSSSSLIKKLLVESNFDSAKEVLGHDFYRMGRIVAGDKNGRKLGFHTANLRLFDIKPLLSGVFAVKIFIDDKSYFGVANWGMRPTFNGTKPKLEVHIFDFNEDVYGHLIKVEFIAKIRDEIKFDSLEQLKQQINLDVVAAKSILGLDSRLRGNDGN